MVNWGLGYHAGVGRGGSGAEEEGVADKAEVPAHLWPHFQGRGGRATLFSATACASAFWAAVCASSAASWLKLTPLL